MKSQPSASLFPLLFLLIFLILALGLYFFLVKSRRPSLSPPLAAPQRSTPSPADNLSASTKLKGKLVCLPQSSNCTYSLLAADGRHYTFKNLSSQDLASTQFQIGDQVTVLGNVLGATDATPSLQITSISK